MIGNKIADKIPSAAKAKIKEKEDIEVNKIHRIYIPPEKYQQIVDALRLFEHVYKNEILKKYKPSRQQT